MKKNNNQHFIIALFGPTGVGKSDAAELLAPYLPIEIINMDVGQFYTPLSIGTAKPAWQTSVIPHRLFDIIQEPQSLTVAKYRDLLLTEIKSLWSRGSIPLLVGGSGFYLMSLLYPPEANKSLSEPTGTWHDLHGLDPERASKIHPKDQYRIKRALAIIQDSGLKPSALKPHFNPIAPFIILDFQRERAELYQRINERTHSMMEQGWMKEVERILDTPWQSFLERKKLIGYDDIIHYLLKPSQDRDYQKLVQTIQQKTRNYAKRQLTFSRKLFSQISQEQAYMQATKSSLIGCNLTLSPINLYINQLLRHPLIQTYQEKE
jgi:tRNA dimethylallyltransferase